MHGALRTSLCSLAVIGLGTGAGAWAAEDPPPDGDVVVKRIIQASPGDLYARILDLRIQETLWPEGCTAGWEHSSTSVGVGASARLTYRAAMMRRRLTATVASGDPGRYLKVDHAGRTGFATTWTLTELEEGTRVELHTWVNPPPKPFTGLYLNQIQPAWLSCHQGLLDNLARSMQSGT